MEFCAHLEKLPPETPAPRLAIARASDLGRAQSSNVGRPVFGGLVRGDGYGHLIADKPARSSKPKS